MSPAAVLHHEIDGPEGAPVLLMTHSLGASGAMWRPQAEALKSRFRVVRADLRGHGRSPAPAGPFELADIAGDAVALLDRLGVARAHLCGLSLGGMVSMWIAAHHPERVDRLVVCCTSAQLGPPEGWRARAAQVRAGGTAAVADDVVARWFTPAFAAEQPALFKEMRDLIATTAATPYVDCCGAIERMDLRGDLAAIRAPTLAIAAAEDPATPPEHLARIADGIEGARLALVSGAAHLANLEKPDEFTALIAAHLQGDRS